MVFNKAFQQQPKGFTFIEVMVAMLIFVLAVLAAVDISRGSVRATRDAKEMSVASWLVQSAMVELETKLEADGVAKGCEKKREGKFPAPYDSYSWVSYCNEIEFNISEEAAKIARGENKEEELSTNESQNAIQKMILQTSSDYIKKSLRELHTEVSWMRGKQKQTVSLTTHFVKYDEPLVIGGGTP